MKIRWTEKEDQFLRKELNNTLFWEIVVIELPGRTKAAVQKRIQTLGLHLSDKRLSEIRTKANKENVESGKIIRMGYKELRQSYILQLRRHANERKIDSTLLGGSFENNKYLYELFNGKCALSGMSIIFKTPGKKQDNTASLDRINPNFGYIKNNVQWVHKRVNEMKWDLMNEEFLSFIKDIYNNKIKNE